MRRRDLEFVEAPVSASLLCPICQEVFCDPAVSAVCGHSFCAACIQAADLTTTGTVTGTTGVQKCPLCRAQYQSSTSDNWVPNVALASLVRELDVYCPNRAHGCQQVLKCDQVDAHLASSCAYAPARCPHAEWGCTFQGNAGSLGVHLQSQCAFEQMKAYVAKTNERLASMEEKMTKQAKDLERLREFVRTSKTRPSVTPPPTGPAEDPSVVVPHPTTPDWPYRPDLSCTNTLRFHPVGVTAIALHQNLLFSGTYVGTIACSTFQQEGGHVRAMVKHHRNAIWSLAYHEGKLFSGSSDKTIGVWSWDGQQLHIQDELCHERKVYGLMVVDNRLYSCSADRLIKIWNPSTLECLQTWSGHTDNVNAIHPYTHNQILSGSSDHSVKVWDTLTNTCISTFLSDASEVLDVTNAGGLILASTYDATIECFDPRLGSSSDTARVCTMVGHNWEVWQLEAPTAEIVFSASFDHTIKRWDLRTRSNSLTLTGHSGYVHALESTPNCLISGCADKTIKIWS